MNNAFRILGLVLLLAHPLLWAAEDVAINAAQIQALGLLIGPLPAKQAGEISGLPAQVVIPGKQWSVVSTPLPALVEQTLVGVGDSVRKGQPLARLQSPALVETQRGFLQARVQTQLAAQNLSRDAALWDEGIISKSRYLATKGLAMDADAAYAERRQQLLLSGMSAAAIDGLKSGANLGSQLQLAAPIAGVVLEKNANAGQRYDAATPLYKIGKAGSLELEIQVPLSGANDLKIGAVVHANAASGKLISIGRSLSGSTQTLLVRAAITQGGESLRPGQFVEAAIRLGAAQWNIANSAISRLKGQTVVYLQTPQGFHAQPIRVYHEGAEYSLIGGDFNGNEKIVLRGAAILKSSLMGIGGAE